MTNDETMGLPEEFFVESYDSVGLAALIDHVSQSEQLVRVVQHCLAPLGVALVCEHSHSLVLVNYAKTKHVKARMKLQRYHDS